MTPGGEPRAGRVLTGALFHVVIGCDGDPLLETFKDPARYDWHEARKVDSQEVFRGRSAHRISPHLVVGQKANRRILSRKPADYLAEIAEHDKTRLEAQFVPMDRHLWGLNRYDDFLVALGAGWPDARQFLADICQILANLGLADRVQIDVQP